MLGSAAKRRNDILLDIEDFNRQRGTTLIWDSVRSLLDDIYEEKCVLEKIEKSQHEWGKEGVPLVNQWNSLSETALANGYAPVLEERSEAGRFGAVTTERLYMVLY